MRHDRLVPDDRLSEVPRTWVGANGYIFPFEARFTAWFLFFGLVASMEGLSAIFLRIPFVMIVAAPGLALAATWGVMTIVDYDTPLRAVLAHLKSGLARAATPSRPARDTSIILSARVKARRARPVQKPLAVRFRRPPRPPRPPAPPTERTVVAAHSPTVGRPRRVRGVVKHLAEIPAVVGFIAVFAILLIANTLGGPRG